MNEVDRQSHARSSTIRRCAATGSEREGEQDRHGEMVEVEVHPLLVAHFLERANSVDSRLSPLSLLKVARSGRRDARGEPVENKSDLVRRRSGADDLKFGFRQVKGALRSKR